MKSKFILISTCLMFGFLSCTQDEKVEQYQESELELLLKESQIQIKNGYKPKVLSDPEGFKKMILEDKVLLSLFKRDGLDVNDIFEPTLKTRTDCGGYNYACTTLEWFADANGSGLPLDIGAEYNMIRDVILGVYTVNDAIGFGYTRINNVQYLSCLATCDVCNVLNTHDLLLYAKLYYGTTSSSECY